jgi:capsular polysaccharide biosynthesis protein
VNPTDYDDQDVFLPAPPVSYFHWLCEVLPNLIQLISLYPQARLVTALERPRYVDESLRLIFGDNFLSEKIVTAQRPLCVPIAAFATMPTASGFVRPEHALALRKAVLDKLSKTEAATTGRKIFISRRGTKARVIPDQDSLEQKFVQDGYRIVQLETMPWVEQVRIFSNAESVAGLHGAGFSNIVFSSDNCSIHEIFPVGYFNDCYCRLCTAIGRKYDYSIANNISIVSQAC